MKAHVVILALLLRGSVVASGQGFINLGFNEPDLSNLPPRGASRDPLTGATADLLRGWKLTADGVPQDTVEYEFFGSYGGGPMVSLVDSAILGSPSDGHGAYFLDVYTFRSPIDRIGLDVRLSQRGTIPPDAEELR